MPKLQRMLALTDKGYENLKKATVACTLTNLSMMIPFGISLLVFTEIIKPLTGSTISWNKIWILFGAGVVGAIIIFMFNKNDYEKAFVAAYDEAERVRIHVAEHIRKLPMNYFNSKDLAELTTNIMGDCANLEHVLSHVFPQMFANIITILWITLCLSIFDWRMALAIFATVPIGFLVIILSKGIQERLGKKHSSIKLNVASKVQDYIDGMNVIKAYGLDGEKFESLYRALKSMKKSAIKFEFITGIFVMSAQMIIQAGTGLTIFVGAVLLTGGRIEFLTLLAFLMISVKIYGPIVSLLVMLPLLFYTQIATNRMRTLLDIKPMSGDSDLDVEHYDIEFKNVSFSYHEDKGYSQVISNVSFKAKQGEVTALVGPSGSGKSTLTRLAARFWDVKEGQVLIGNEDVRNIEPEHLMSYMSFVFQDVVLFNDTVFNNIKVGRENATEEEVYMAAKIARCDSFISEMPKGYNTMLGENGATLSGGERQRISIARALLKDAPIILLDEMTASLDPENEAAIQQALSELIRDKTVIVIAHRLRTIVEADKIIVMDEGSIVEEGRHDELVSNRGLYKKLYSIQKETSDWSVGSKVIL